MTSKITVDAIGDGKEEGKEKVLKTDYDFDSGEPPKGPCALTFTHLQHDTTPEAAIAISSVSADHVPDIRPNGPPNNFYRFKYVNKPRHQIPTLPLAYFHLNPTKDIQSELMGSVGDFDDSGFSPAFTTGLSRYGTVRFRISFKDIIYCYKSSVPNDQSIGFYQSNTVQGSLPQDGTNAVETIRWKEQNRVIVVAPLGDQRIDLAYFTLIDRTTLCSECYSNIFWTVDRSECFSGVNVLKWCNLSIAFLQVEGSVDHILVPGPQVSISAVARVKPNVPRVRGGGVTISVQHGFGNLITAVIRKCLPRGEAGADLYFDHTFKLFWNVAWREGYDDVRKLLMRLQHTDYVAAYGPNQDHCALDDFDFPMTGSDCRDRHGAVEITKFYLELLHVKFST